MKYLVPVLAAVLIITGCGGKRTAGVSVESLTIAFQEWVGYGPFYLIKEKGFDREEGYELVIVDEQLDAARRDAFKAGMLDCEAAPLDLLISKAAQDVPIVMVVGIDLSFGSDAIVAMPAIQKLEDLPGKKIVLARDDVGETFLTALLYKKGLSSAPLDLEPEMPEKVAEAFLGGQGDACVTWEPQVSKALQRPGAHILASSKEYPGIILDSLNVRKDLVRDRPELVKKLIRSWFRAVRYYQDHPGEAAALVAPYFHLAPEDYQKQVGGLRWYRYEEQIGDPEYREWIEGIRLLSDVKMAGGRIRQKPEPTSLVDRRLLQELYENRQ
jgi:NitT/TauT family transport system substrate-binding protein